MGNCLSGTPANARSNKAPGPPSKLDLQLIEAIKKYALEHGSSIKSLNSCLLKFPTVAEGFETVRKVFTEHDTNSDGALDLEEFHRACVDMKWPIPQEKLDTIYKESDMDDSQSIDFKEFVVIVTIVYLLEPFTSEEDDAALRKAIDICVSLFCFFDVDRSGFIQKTEVDKVLDVALPGGGAGKGDLAALRFHEMDWNTDNRVSFKEFLFAMESWVGVDEEE